MTVGVDVSHYQPPAQLAAAIAAGARFVICKATEGPDGTDVRHAAHVAAVRNAGLRLGHYHFARDVRLYAMEADHFLKVAAPQPGDAVALDLEGMNGTDAEQLAYALAWLRRVAVATGARPLFYTYLSRLSALLHAATGAQRAELQSYPLWIATGGRTAGQPGINGWAMHQFSTAGGIDHDLLAGGVEWSDFAIPLAVSDAPAPVLPAPFDLGEDMARLYQNPPESGVYYAVSIKDNKPVVTHVPDTIELNALRLAGADVDVPFTAEQLKWLERYTPAI